MERADRPSTGGEYSGDAPSSESWDNFAESPPRPFPERFPEFSRNYSHGERFAGMNNEASLTNYNDGSPEIRDDPKSCFVVSTTFSFFVVLTMAFGLYAPESLKLGPHTSILMKPSRLIVESIKVQSLDAKGLVLYGFYKDPLLDVKTTWSETHKVILPASSHKEWVYYLNKGSHINISYSVHSRTSSSIVLVIAEGDNGLVEWLKDPSYPNLTPSWNIYGNGIIRKDISDSSTYYIAVGNLNAEYAEVHLNTTIQAFLYNTSESYYKCTPADEQCTFQLLLSGGNVAVLTSPGRLPGIISGDWHVKLSYEPRWVTYLVGLVGITFLLLLAHYFLNHFRRTEQDTHRDFERNALLSHKDDDRPSLGSSYDSVSDDEKKPTEDDTHSGKSVNDAEDKQLCAICFDAPKNCFFIPCGHCAACFGCSTKIVESSGTCPICRRRTKKVRKIYNV